MACVVIHFGIALKTLGHMMLKLLKKKKHEFSRKYEIEEALKSDITRCVLFVHYSSNNINIDTSYLPNNVEL